MNVVTCVYNKVPELWFVFKNNKPMSICDLASIDYFNQWDYSDAMRFFEFKGIYI